MDNTARPDAPETAGQGPGDRPRKPDTAQPGDAPDRACKLAGAAAAYVLIPVLIATPSTIIYLFTRDIEEAILWPLAVTLAAVLGLFILGIALFCICAFLAWMWEEAAMPVAEWCQRRKDRRATGPGNARA